MGCAEERTVSALLMRITFVPAALVSARLEAGRAVIYRTEIQTISLVMILVHGSAARRAGVHQLDFASAVRAAADHEDAEIAHQQHEQQPPSECLADACCWLEGLGSHGSG